MHKNYKAIDLRGYPCGMYEKVYQVYKYREEKPDYEYLGVELSTNDLREIGKLKKTPIFVRGGTEEKNRRILENKRVSVLSSPYPVNHFQAKLASKNGTAFEINVSEIVRAHGYARAILMEKLQKTIRVARKYHSPILITSGATSELEVKSPRVLVAFGKILGLEYYEAKACIYNVPKLILLKVKG